MPLLLILLVVAPSIVNANLLFSADRTLNTQQCLELVSAIDTDGRQKMSGGGPLVSLSKELDASVHRIMTTHATAYLSEQVIQALRQPEESLVDSGYFWMIVNDTHKDMLLFDPVLADPRHRRLLFGALVFLNDNVAGGELSIQTGAPQPVVLQPECGRLVMFPFTFAVPKTIRRVRVGTLYLLSVAFYASVSNE